MYCSSHYERARERKERPRERERERGRDLKFEMKPKCGAIWRQSRRAERPHAGARARRAISPRPASVQPHAMREIAHSGSVHSYCSQDDSSSQSKSHDTIGTIPKVAAQTGAATPGDMEAYVARSVAEVGCQKLCALEESVEVTWAEERRSVDGRQPVTRAIRWICGGGQTWAISWPISISPERCLDYALRKLYNRYIPSRYILVVAYSSGIHRRNWDGCIFA